MEPDPKDPVGLPEARTGMGPEDDLKLSGEGRGSPGRGHGASGVVRGGLGGGGRSAKASGRIPAAEGSTSPASYSDPILPPFTRGIRPLDNRTSQHLPLPYVTQTNTR